MMLAAFGMPEESALPLAFVFALATALILRAREVHWWAAALIFLCGFYVSQTAAFYMIYDLVGWLTSRLLG
ncbi:hypothetical protein ACIQVO_17910 [Streptomyces sp. NPDC101062]|uniref:hypothetical protein n=1 Tax=unclassified Streptomyces TaxID=2593676 RepID=UPI003817D739